MDGFTTRDLGAVLLLLAAVSPVGALIVWRVRRPASFRRCYPVFSVIAGISACALLAEAWIMHDWRDTGRGAFAGAMAWQLWTRAKRDRAARATLPKEHEPLPRSP